MEKAQDKQKNIASVEDFFLKNFNFKKEQLGFLSNQNLPDFYFEENGLFFYKNNTKMKITTSDILLFREEEYLKLNQKEFTSLTRSFKEFLNENLFSDFINFVMDSKKVNSLNESTSKNSEDIKDGLTSNINTFSCDDSKYFYKEVNPIYEYSLKEENPIVSQFFALKIFDLFDVQNIPFFCGKCDGKNFLIIKECDGIGIENVVYLKRIPNEENSEREKRKIAEYEKFESAKAKINAKFETKDPALLRFLFIVNFFSIGDLHFGNIRFDENGNFKIFDPLMIIDERNMDFDDISKYFDVDFLKIDKSDTSTRYFMSNYLNLNLFKRQPISKDFECNIDNKFKNLTIEEMKNSLSKVAFILKNLPDSLDCNCNGFEASNQIFKEKVEKLKNFLQKNGITEDSYINSFEYQGDKKQEQRNDNQKMLEFLKNHGVDVEKVMTNKNTNTEKHLEIKNTLSSLENVKHNLTK